MTRAKGKRKVLMLTQYLHMGGLERMIFSLSTSLKEGGAWEPRVFVFDRLPDAAPENDLGPALEEEGIPVEKFAKPSGFSPRTALRIRRKLREEGIGVLHTHDLGALIYGACAKLLSLGRVRLVHTQHSFIHFTRRKIYKLYERVFTRFADEIAVVSEDTKKSYVELGLPQAKIHVIPNGVSFPAKPTAGPESRRQGKKRLLGKLEKPVRAALERFEGAHWILYMARLHRVKGQNHALDVWRRLPPRVRGKCVLLFVGPESEAGRLSLLRAGIDGSPDSARVQYVGSTFSPEDWLGCADLLLSCSEFEGMPLGPIEAAGAGLPMVLSAIPGHELLKGFSRQYPLGDPGQGARQVEDALAELESRPVDYFKSAWEKGSEIRSRYDLAHMSAAYARLYSTEVSAS